MILFWHIVSIAVLVIRVSPYVESMPVFQVEDVDLLPPSTGQDNLDPSVIQGSIETLRSSMTEPNFFWSGSGETEDSGMTYWITTTIYKTTTVTLSTDDNNQTSASEITSSFVERVPETQTTAVVTIRSQSGQLPSRATVNPLITVTQMFTQLTEAEYWIRTVIQTNSDEQNRNFSQQIERRLKRIYSWIANETLLDRKRRDVGEDDVHIFIQNITRPFRDANVHVIYSVASGNPYRVIRSKSAVRALFENQRDNNLTALLCYDSDGNQDLCHAVITKAEPYLQYDSNQHLLTQYWIIGASLGATLSLAIIVLATYYLIRKWKRKQALMQPSTTSISVRPGFMEGSINLAFEKDNLGKESIIDLTGRNLGKAVPNPTGENMSKIETSSTEHLIRKSRSTSRKRGRHRHRPKTAPEMKQKWRSSSNLTTHSSSSERTEYRKCSEEPFQPSRSCRHLKRKSRKKTTHLQTLRSQEKDRKVSSESSASPAPLSPNEDNVMDDIASSAASNLPNQRNQQRLSVANLDLVEDNGTLKTRELEAHETITKQPIPKPRRLTRSPVVETEIQECSTEFLENFEMDAENDAAEELGEPVAQVADREPEMKSATLSKTTKWRPGSLIPPRIACAVFGSGSRRVSSAPIRPLKNPVTGEGRSVSPLAVPLSNVGRRAWVSSQQMDANPEEPEPDMINSPTLIRPVVHSRPPSSNPPVSHSSHQQYHVHSFSYPAWPSLSETDPAIDLIKAIKEELKKFDHESHC